MTEKEIQESIEETKAKLAPKRNPKGEIVGYEKTLDNVKIILNNDIRFKDRLCYNEVDLKVYKLAPFPWEENKKKNSWDIDDKGLKPLDPKRDVLEMERIIQRDYGQSTKDVESQYIGNAMDCSYNPVKTLLESLKWDGKEHIRYLLPKYLGVVNDEYQYQVMRLTFLALIERQYRPGADYHCTLALNGAQGLGKSTFCRKFAFDDSSYFTDNLGDLSDTNTLQIVAGKLVIELAEMLSKKKTKEQEAFKRFASASFDTFRAPYAPTFEDHPRRCVVIATSNENEYLDDPTGNRRWLCVECHAENVPDKMAIQYSQDEFMKAWAEAFHDWKELRKKGPLDLIGMSYDLAEQAKEHAEMHEETDPYEGLIKQYLDNQRELLEKSTSTEPARVCALEIATVPLHIDRPTRFELKDITKILDNKCPEWTRNQKRQRCGIYGLQTCWEYNRLSDPKSIPEKASTTPSTEMTEDDIASYEATFS